MAAEGMLCSAAVRFVEGTCGQNLTLGPVAGTCAQDLKLGPVARTGGWRLVAGTCGQNLKLGPVAGACGQNLRLEICDRDLWPELEA